MAGTTTIGTAPVSTRSGFSVAVGGITGWTMTAGIVMTGMTGMAAAWTGGIAGTTGLTGTGIATGGMTAAPGVTATVSPARSSGKTGPAGAHLLSVRSQRPRALAGPFACPARAGHLPA